MTITTFDKTNLRELRDDVTAALQEVARKHNIMIDMGGIRFGENEARCKLTMRSFGGRVMTVADVKAGHKPEEIAVNEIAKRNGLPDNLFGRKVIYGGQTLTVVGAKASRHKYPFVVEGVRGGKYKMSVEQIRNGLV